VRWARRDLLRAGAALGAALLTACTSRHGGRPAAGATPPPDLPAAVTLGVFEYRPYVFRDRSGRLTGEVVEVARAVCARLGIHLEVELTPYETVLTRMAEGGFDVVGGLEIAARNCVTVDFSVPDHVSLTALAVPEGNPKRLTTFTEVAATGARLALVAGSLEIGAAQEAGIRGLNVYATSDIMLAAVQEGRADCAAYDDITLRDRVSRLPGLEVRPPFEPAGGAPVYGFGFPKDGEDLRTAFDEVLAELHETGDWLRIARPFGFTDRNLPEGDAGEHACAG
jgi:polar amino acid transport system substrate-binding protein